MCRTLQEKVGTLPHSHTKGGHAALCSTAIAVAERYVVHTVWVLRTTHVWDGCVTAVVVVVKCSLLGYTSYPFH